MNQVELIPHLFRTEYSKIIAVLYHSFRLKDLETAEDIASETFLKATEVWGIGGIPDNPTAWLYTVAKNKAKDYFKRNTVFEKVVKDAVRADNTDNKYVIEFSDENITDSQLAMIFAVCDPDNSPEAQISLALQILCGFSVEEITTAFLAKHETIKKRLQRARHRLGLNNFQIGRLSDEQINERLAVVLKTIYLLFNEGYFSKTHNQLIRKDLCTEAIRLAFILTQTPKTCTSQVHALLALMCFQSSRLDARTSKSGEIILFDDQDRSVWNKELIGKGNQYLVQAYQDHQISKYHIEATIAYWHSTSEGEEKWQHILQLYNQLVLTEYSPITALNRAFAFAKVFGNAQAIHEAKKLNLTGSNSYYSLLGYLYAENDVATAIDYYEQAIAVTKSNAEIQSLKTEIARLKAKE